MEDFRLKMPTGGVSGGYGRNCPYSILKLIMSLPQGMDDTISSVPSFSATTLVKTLNPVVLFALSQYHNRM